MRQGTRVGVLGFGVVFEASLLQRGGCDDSGELVRREVVIQLAEYPDLAVLGFAIAATCPWSVGHGDASFPMCSSFFSAASGLREGPRYGSPVMN
jgi:hypothetical protein